MELSKTKFQLYSSLVSRKMREKHRLFVISGEKSVEDIRGTFTIESIILAKNFLPSFDISEVQVYEANESQMKKISSWNSPPNVIAICRIPDSMRPEIDNTSLYLLLDDIQDPGNLGTIIRTCHWFGITTVFASRNTVDIYNPKTLQSTMGSIGKVKVVYCDLLDLISRNSDMPVYGMLLEGKDLFRENLSNRGFIIMGNEGNGISMELRNLITNPLTIPPYCPNHPESLNVAIATAITLAQFRK